MSLLFGALAHLRRQYLRYHRLKLPVPVVVVGNISVGGTGKTPLIIVLAQHLKDAGLRPGIISRGYGVQLERSQLVTAAHSAAEVGDEPRLIFEASGCDVAVGPDRVESARLLIEQQGCDLILSDDGLQHYRLARDFEIAVIDSKRGFGNGWRLPVGPLREPPARLVEVDWIVVHGEASPTAYVAPNRLVPMHLRPVAWQNVKTGQRTALDALDLSKSVAVAGIGNPERFFTSLEKLGFDGPTRSFADHHAFSSADFAACAGRRVLMTSKDAVKCQAFAEDDWWALQVEAVLPSGFLNHIKQQLAKRQRFL